MAKWMVYVVWVSLVLASVEGRPLRGEHEREVMKKPEWFLDGSPGWFGGGGGGGGGSEGGFGGGFGGFGFRHSFGFGNGIGFSFPGHPLIGAKPDSVGAGASRP